MNIPKVYRVWLLIVLATLLSWPVGADAKEPPVATLRLVNGDFVAGGLCESNRPDVLRWQGVHFAAPFDFNLGAVSAVRFPSSNERVKPKGEYCFEFQGGDLLFGSLVALNPKEVEVDSPRFGRLHIQRPRLERIVRWRDGEGMVYVGPNGMSEWKELGPAGAWRQEANHLTTDQDGACIAGDPRIPPRACIELELSWTKAPDFMLTLGARGNDDKQAFHIETLDRALACVWETENEADLATLQPIADGAGRCRLTVYLDQPRRRAVVFSADGALLADVRVSDAKSEPKSGFYLLNRRGDLRLEQLRIRKLGGDMPQPSEGGKSRLSRMDGSTVLGNVERYDADKREFVLVENGRETRVEVAQVESIVQPQSNEAPPRDVHACLQDGARLSGKLREVKGDRIWIESPGVAEPLGVSMSDMQQLSVLNRSKPAGAGDGRQGRLEMADVRLQGCLVDGAELSRGGCLAWRPRGSATASPLEPCASGKIVYRETPPRIIPPSATYARAVPVRQVRPAVGVDRWVEVLAGSKSPPSAPRGHSKNTGTLYLGTGDAVPCQIKRIDKNGVWFESSEYQATFVPHDKIKAVNLENAVRDTKVNPTKRDRLLTLPRMKKDSPPTHLIRSVDGDYLRANVISMDEKTLTVEVRLEERRLPRSGIARIIWLHEGDASEASPETAAAAQRPAQTRVQALRRDGNRVTFLFEKLTGTVLSGTSELLRQCRVDLTEIDQLLFGKMSEQTAKDLPYQRWKLSAAQEPAFVKKDAASGTESALVGKPAPDFKLEKLDGTPFRLSEQRGKVVVLDFWATWCGACIQALPQIDHLVGQLKNPDVLLVAVNLQETPEAIHAALKRLKLDTNVVLDQDGAVAGKYAAVAIPQTVIIDRSGRVARIFVGGGPQYVEQVQEALQKILLEGDGQGASK